MLLPLADVVTAEKRSEMMAGIKYKNTKPEIFIRKNLHKLGFRYRLHSKNLPGKPDILLPKYKAIIFVHGCFWHKHNCHLFKWPKTRIDFWRKKIESNVKNDLKHIPSLKQQGWRVLIVWECALKGKTRLPEYDIIEIITKWIKSDSIMKEVLGRV